MNAVNAPPYSGKYLLFGIKMKLTHIEWILLRLLEVPWLCQMRTIEYFLFSQIWFLSKHSLYYCWVCPMRRQKPFFTPALTVMKYGLCLHLGQRPSPPLIIAF